MSFSPPTPPQELPHDAVDTLDDYAPKLLQHVARHAEELAEDDETNIEARPDDLPDDVPAKATITLKEINDSRYYWQWRYGEKIHLKYKGPVTPDEYRVSEIRAEYAAYRPSRHFIAGKNRMISRVTTPNRSRPGSRGSPRPLLPSSTA